MRSNLSPLLLAGVVACGGAERTSAPATPVDQVTLIAPDSALIGQVVQLEVELRDAAGNLLSGRNITFESSNGSVAVVSPAGILTIGDTGTAIITASSEGVQGTHPLSGWAIRFSAVSAGDNESCGLSVQGTPWCWGQMAGGATPVPLADQRVYVAIDVGFGRACGLTAAGEVTCWTNPAQGATPVAGAPPLARITLGKDHTCGLDLSGLGYCWGDNSSGRLGTGVGQSSPSPAAVAGGAHYRTLSAGIYHTCAVQVNGAGSCWGSNGNAQLGDSTAAGGSYSPTMVSGGLALQAIGSGLFHSCGIAADSTAWCWGDNPSGLLGNNSTYFARGPVAVAGGHRFSAIDPGDFTTCALAVNGAAWCWGGNSWGVLGAGLTAADGDSVPVAVAGSHVFTQLSAGPNSHVCALSSTGVAWCWGANQAGQLGVSGIPSSNVPVKVMGQVGS